MKTFTIVAPFIAVLAANVVADQCVPGRKYCGHALRDLSHDYKDLIAQALYTGGRSEWDGANALFYCAGGEEGVISLVEGCPGGCKAVDDDDEEKAGKSDACR